jgi:twinkle protein
VRALELAAQLAAQAPEVCRLLLPNGKRAGREWLCGSVQGEAGDSLKVCLSGNKAGVWSDFASGEKGDLVGLWMAVRGLALFDACREIHQHLGIPEEPRMPRDRTYAKPSREGVKPLHDLPRHWLHTVRKLTDKSLSAYKIAVKGDAIMFPYLRDGELVFAKYRPWNDKRFHVDANCEPALFGWQALSPTARAVILTEGEFDAMALYEYGFPALSVPFGGGGGDKQRWIDTEYERLAAFDEIFLCLDADKDGQVATEEIARRLGRERCRVVSLPRKDANDCLIAGVPEADIAQAIANARTLDPKQLRNAGDYEDAVIREFERMHTGDVGLRLPWPDRVGDRLILRDGEVSVWAGINGHGKSQVVGQILLHALDAVKACAASLEFRPEKFLRRLHCQAAGVRNVERAHSRAISGYLRERLWVLDITGTAKGDGLLEVFRYASRRYGIKLFVIDNLAKCGFDEDDHAGSKNFIDRLTDFAKEMNVHLMLVHHTRKTEHGEDRPPSKMDIKGSGGITDMADTVVTVWRNKPKERAMREANGNPLPADILNQPDCKLTCFKQRNGDDEPAVSLWFEPWSYQYLERSAGHAHVYVGARPEPAQEVAL